MTKTIWVKIGYDGLVNSIPYTQLQHDTLKYEGYDTGQWIYNISATWRVYTSGGVTLDDNVAKYSLAGKAVSQNPLSSERVGPAGYTTLAWKTVNVSDGFVIPWKDDFTGLSGSYHFDSSSKTGISLDTTINFSTSVVGSLSFGDFKLSTNDSLPTIFENALTATGFSGLGAAVKNALTVRDALTNVVNGGVDLITLGMKGAGDPSFDAKAYDALVNAYMHGAQTTFEDALKKTVLIPGNPLADAQAHNILEAMRLIETGTGAFSGTAQLGLDINVAGVANLAITATGSVTQVVVIDGHQSGDTVSGGLANNILIGGQGSNTLIGNVFRDYLNGGGGDDILSGGPVNGDFLNGGDGVDTAVFSQPQGGVSISYAGGAFHVNDVSTPGATADTVMDTEYFSFAGAKVFAERTLLPTNAAVADYNGDGKADILWRSQGSGATVIWQMNGSHSAGGGLTDQFAAAPWTVMGSGDFNGDGRADLLWRNDTTGQTAVWGMQGQHLASVGMTGLLAGNDWYVAGISDYGGDGKADLLWRNVTTGATVVWNMNGSAVTTWSFTDAYAPPNWAVAGSGDFNGDHKTDILWRNTADGSTFVWLMDDAHALASGFTSAYAPTGWSVAGVADFNGDGRDDILWRNPGSGQTVVWTMNGETVTSGGVTDGYAPTAWSVAGVGDFDGDHKADILWRNDVTQQTLVWEMNGQNILSSGFTDGFAGNGWSFT